MKKLLMFFALMIGLVSCGSGDNTAAAKSPEKDRVEVIYFHGKQRCATCMAIEKNAKEVVNTLFANELKNGTVVFKTVDISTRREKKSPTNTKLHGLLSLSTNGKTVRRAVTTSLSLASGTPVKILTASRKVLQTKSANH